MTGADMKASQRDRLLLTADSLARSTNPLDRDAAVALHALLAHQPAATGKAAAVGDLVGTVHVQATFRNGAHEAREPIVNLARAFEARLDAMPGVVVPIYAAPLDKAVTLARIAAAERAAYEVAKGHPMTDEQIDAIHGKALKALARGCALPPGAVNTDTIEHLHWRYAFTRAILASQPAPSATCSVSEDCKWPNCRRDCVIKTDPAPPAQTARTEQLRAEVERLNAIINTPHAGDFLRAVSIEAEHQRQTHSADDGDKTPTDWFWLVGYLAGKALHAHASDDAAKAEHHIITTAAALANWHRNMFGTIRTIPTGDEHDAH